MNEYTIGIAYVDCGENAAVIRPLTIRAANDAALHDMLRTTLRSPVWVAQQTGLDIESVREGTDPLTDSGVDDYHVFQVRPVEPSDGPSEPTPGAAERWPRS